MAHRLSVTKVHFHTRRSPEDKRPLGDLDEAGAMATDFFGRHFERAMWNERDDDDESGDASAKRHAVRGIGELLPTGRPDVVAGMMLAGERGIVAEYYKGDFVTKTGDRDEETIEAPRVLALAYMPHRETEGYLITHSYHNRYFKTGLMASLRPAVVNAFAGDLTIKMNAWAPMADVAAMIRQGPILKINLFKHKRVDNYQAFTHSAGGTLGLELMPEGDAKANFNGRTLAEAAQDPELLDSLLTVDGITYNEMVIKVRHRGSTRDLVLGAPNFEWISWDVSHQLSSQSRPDPKQLVEAALELLTSQGLLK